MQPEHWGWRRTRLKAEKQKSWFNFQNMHEILLFSKAARLVLVPTQPPIQCNSGAFSPAVKYATCKADHSSPSSVVAEWVEPYLQPPHAFMACTEITLFLHPRLLCVHLGYFSTTIYGNQWQWIDHQDKEKMAEPTCHWNKNSLCKK